VGFFCGGGGGGRGSRITNAVNFKHINKKNVVYFKAMGAIHFSLKSTLISSCRL